MPSNLRMASNRERELRRKRSAGRRRKQLPHALAILMMCGNHQSGKEPEPAFKRLIYPFPPQCYLIDMNLILQPDTFIVGRTLQG
jgi:hypothetical protein